MRARLIVDNACEAASISRSSELNLMMLLRAVSAANADSDEGTGNFPRPSATATTAMSGHCHMIFVGSIGTVGEGEGDVTGDVFK